MLTDNTMFEQMTPTEAQAYAEGAAAAEPERARPESDVLDGMSPYEVGRADARDGEPCLPSLYFAARENVIWYVLGWQGVAGETPFTAAMLGREPDVDETPGVHPAPWG